MHADRSRCVARARSLTQALVGGDDRWYREKRLDLYQLQWSETNRPGLVASEGQVLDLVVLGTDGHSQHHRVADVEGTALLPRRRHQCRQLVTVMPATVNNVDLAVAEVVEEAGPLLLPVGQAGRHLEEVKVVKAVKVKVKMIASIGIGIGGIRAAAARPSRQLVAGRNLWRVK